MSYGVFVELEPLVNGSECTWNDGEAALKKEVKKGQKIKVKIINIDKEKKKSLYQLKKMFANSWDEAFGH
jgi:ribosomal protein S1